MTRICTIIVLAFGLVGCATSMDHRLEPLQNPVYAGIANRDLVPYQAQNRDDLSACVWSLLNVESIAALSQPVDADADLEAGLRRCMEAKGWRTP